MIVFYKILSLQRFLLLVYKTFPCMGIRGGQAKPSQTRRLLCTCRPLFPHQLMEAPVEYCGRVLSFMVFAAFWSSRLLTGSLTGTEESLGSLCHFKSLARTYQILKSNPFFDQPKSESVKTHTHTYSDQLGPQAQY